MRTRQTQRQGFTLVELLVAVALIVLIMSIVSQAFVDGLETFRQLKGIGDLQEELRSSVVPLRNDLLAKHITPPGTTNNRQKLSDLVPPVGYQPQGGYFRIQTGQFDPVTKAYVPGSSVLLEGADSNGLQSFTATNHILSFAIFVTGSSRYNWMSAGAPYGGGALVPPQDASSLQTGQGAPSDYTLQPSVMLGQSAEVCWFLSPQIITDASGNPVQATATAPNGGGSGTPLWGLYRRQRLLVPNNTAINTPPSQILSTNVGLFPEVSCKPNGLNLYFSSPPDVTQPSKRAFMDPLGQLNSVVPMGFGPGENTLSPSITTSDLVVSNVVSFEVKVLFAGTYQFMDVADAQTYFQTNVDPTVTVNGTYDTATTPMSMYRVLAIQVTLRIWNPKTEQTRQITMIQDM